MIEGPYQTTPRQVMYRGKRFHLNGQGYWIRRIPNQETGKLSVILLHRIIYDDMVAPLCPTLIVHHRDDDRKNFHPDNLEAMTISAHMRHHHPNGIPIDDDRRARCGSWAWTEEGRKRQSEKQKEAWVRRRSRSDGE